MTNGNLIETAVDAAIGVIVLKEASKIIKDKKERKDPKLLKTDVKYIEDDALVDGLF